MWVRLNGHISQGEIRIPNKGRRAHNNIKLLHFFFYNMLLFSIQVLKDGTFTSTAKNKKLNYGTMVFMRATIIWDVSAKSLAQACTIATRYSCVRRQSEMKPG